MQVLIKCRFLLVYILVNITFLSNLVCECLKVLLEYLIFGMLLVSKSIPDQCELRILKNLCSVEVYFAVTQTCKQVHGHPHPHISTQL